ncbi:MAG: LLM class flavin-dependent oxidoreductase [Rhizorhabdus sp.]|nr:LLM class flavin-dependent oxidoreductase [Rhizorhabdus sp.]
MTMETGLIFHPYMRPGRTARQTFEWGVQSAIASDKAGFDSMMISEHASQIWENIPNPELIMSAAALQTSRIKFAPMAHLLPHQHPTKLAMTVGWLSQILEGRYFLGIGAGAYPAASYMHGIRGENMEGHRLEDAKAAFASGEMSKRLNDMVRESLYIMEKIWAREPFFFEGKYWNAGFPEEEPAHTEDDEQHKLADFSPWGGAFPEVAVTGFSLKSPSMKLAGEKNFKPVSIFSGLEALKWHWDIYSEANIKAGFTPDRQRHAVSHTIFVGDTDAEAKREVMEGPIGYCFNKYLIPIWRRFGMMAGFAKDHGIDELDADLEFLVDKVFIVGSPDTVVEKMNELFTKCGGWGTLQIESHDYYDDPSPWFHSLELAAKEVAPRISLPKQ